MPTNNDGGLNRYLTAVLLPAAIDRVGACKNVASVTYPTTPGGQPTLCRIWLEPATEGARNIYLGGMDVWFEPGADGETLKFTRRSDV
jgi:hypothetical protein